VKKVYTLCIVHQHPLVLLAKKKLKLGAGNYNGYGGRVEDGETIEEAAKRETFEESGIQVGAIEKLGVNEFVFQGQPDTLEVHIFKAEDFAGDPKETPEMGPPQWFAVSEIPYEEMWIDDKYWLPLFIEGKKFKGKFICESEKKILEHTLDEVESLD
jgi:8-oxo-dGTP diphosphatase/2-hydroxy-dATP diphosphatase